MSPEFSPIYRVPGSCWRSAQLLGCQCDQPNVAAAGKGIEAETPPPTRAMTLAQAIRDVSWERGFGFVRRVTSTRMPTPPLCHWAAGSALAGRASQQTHGASLLEGKILS